MAAAHGPGRVSCHWGEFWNEPLGLCKECKLQGCCHSHRPSLPLPSPTPLSLFVTVDSDGPSGAGRGPRGQLQSILHC